MAADPPEEPDTPPSKLAEPVECGPLTKEQESPSAEQLRQLFGLVSGYRISQAIYVAAKLDLPGLLADGPRASEELAEATGTHAGALYRVLRFLAGVGLFDEVAPHRFSLTSLGAGLRQDVPGTVRPNVLMALDGYHWQAWGALLHSVQTGEIAFNYVHGMGLFDYLSEHAETGTIFNQAMMSNTARSGTAIIEAYDFSSIQRLADVGGGHGLMLATILRAYPAMQGVLFDRAEMLADATAVLEEAGVSDRCKIVAGDFFASVPTGCDAYILRQIIHDWDDAQAIHILKNCHRSLQGRGKVLVVERSVGSDYRQALQVLHLDLEMLVMLGGCQRTDEEYRTLFAAAGFQLTTIISLNDAAQYRIFEGRPV